MASGEQTKKVVLEVVMNDKTSKELSNLSKNTKVTTSGMMSAFTSLIGKATLVAGAIGGIGLATYKLAERTGQIEKMRTDFDKLSNSIGSNMADSMDKLTKATRGTVSQFDLMDIGNRIMLQGIAKNSTEMEKIVKIADRLGSQTLTTKERVNEFTQLLRNQSIMMLDNFGISSGVVRDRIAELQAQFPEMSRETAFLTATMEQAEGKMTLLGDATETSHDKWLRMNAVLTDAKDKIFTALSPIIEGITLKISDLADELVIASDELLNGTTPATRGLHWALTDENEGLGPALERTKTLFNDMVNSLTGDNASILENFTTMITGWIWIFGKILDGINAVIGAVGALAREINKLPSFSKVSAFDNGTVGGGAGAKAIGGNNFRLFGTGSQWATGGITDGNLSMVGENGPELVKLPKGSHVYNNNDSGKMIGNGTINVNINAPVYGVDNFEALVINTIKKAQSDENSLSRYNLAI